MSCYSCEHLHDEFGNFVSCDLLHVFVDWYYWNDQTPKDCPLNKQKDKELENDKISIFKRGC